MQTGSGEGKSLLFLRSPKGDVGGRHCLRPDSCNLDFRPVLSLKPELSSNSEPVLHSVLVVAGKHQAEQESQAVATAGVSAPAISHLPSVSCHTDFWLTHP